MSNKKTKNSYDDGNIPEVDLPKNNSIENKASASSVRSFPESSRPRKDGPGGN